MKILIVGGAGYIGSALVARLMQHHSEFNVTVVDSLIFGSHALHTWQSYPNFDLVRGDGRDLDVQGYDAVINLAAYSLPLCKQYPDRGMEINRDMAIQLAEQCAKYGSKYIFSSTCSNYGVKADGYATEQDSLYPTSVYAKSKVETESALLGMENLRAVIFRFATAYGLGARFRPDLILHDFIREALIDGKITLMGPTFYRPLCHVDDIARAILWGLGYTEKKAVYNIGNTEHNFTKMQLAEMIQQRTDCEIITSESIPDPRNYKVNFDKARSELGFETLHTVKAEIGKIIDAYENGLLSFEAQKLHAIIK